MSTSLLERDHELATIEELLQAADRGQGAGAAVVGPAGIGKTSLLDAGAARAQELRMGVLRARGSELEQTFAFGVARQLFESALRRRDEHERDALLAGTAGLAAPVLGMNVREPPPPAGDAREATLLGLYWLLENLTLAEPVLLLVDDLHWADRASIEWLLFAVRRLESTSAAVLVGARSGEGERAAADLLDSGVASILPLQPLGAVGVNAIVRERLGPAVDDGFADACGRAAGGNPMLLRELCRALVDGQIAPVADNAPQVDEVTSDRLERFVAARLASAGPTAARLARAVAILGPDVALRDAAALADLDIEVAAAAGDELRAADLLAPHPSLSFGHPILAHAIRARIPPGARALAHTRAARVRTAAGAPDETVAAHLLEAEPAGDGWALERLIAAAEQAIGKGAPDEAVLLLRRADREGAQGDRARLLLLLGLAESRVADPIAATHLEAAYALEADPLRRADAGLALARTLLMQGRGPEAFAIIERETDAIRAIDPERAMQLDAELCATARLTPGWTQRAAARLDRAPGLAGDSAGERALLACAAGDMVCRGVSARDVADVAQRALGGGALLEETLAESPVFCFACVALTWTDRLASARRQLADGAEQARARGSVIALAHVAAWTAEVELRAGRLHEATAQAALALECAVGIGGMVPNALAPAWLVLSLLERDRAEEARAVLTAGGGEAEPPELGAFTPLYYARGCVRLGERRLELALADFETTGRILLSSSVTSPSLLPWRSAAARAHAALGSPAEALALAREEHELARSAGAPRALGIALRCLGSLTLGDDGVELHRQAVEVLADSEARLDHAHAVCDLGAALRRRGHRREGREPLKLALDLAVGCGATALARRARGELAASGARPRRIRVSGRDALTPAELRAAELAAEGLSNREVAQALFVTVKTVETQFGQVYGKLGISSRRELPTALRADTGVESAGTARR